MARLLSSLALSLLTALALAACGPARSTSQSGEQGGGPAASPASQRALVILIRAEVPSLAAKPLAPYSGSLSPPIRFFNAMLDFIDEKEVPHPYLADALPSPTTDTWRVLPDGRMETVHRLRPNLAWHDGVPLSVDDFVFGLKVYSAPELGTSRGKPISLMEEIVAADPRTVIIRWRQPFAEADRMDARFQPLPHHLLEQAFQSVPVGDAPPFVNHPYWTVEYVGLGPYKLVRWEPGAFLEATAFDGHALGRPKIDRIRLVPMADANTALANLLGGEAHFVASSILGLEEGLTLEREWAGRDAGTVFFPAVTIRHSKIQFRPEYARPKALQDVRVRRAIAHAFDVPGALEVLTGGHGVTTWSLTSPRSDFYPAIEPLITKRPYDPRTTQRLLEEAGFTRGADGVFVSPTGERLELELWNTGAGAYEQENRIFVASLRRAGIDAIPKELGAALLRDVEYRALLPGLFTGGAAELDSRLRQHSVEDIPRVENRWQGDNRGGWENAEYQRLWEAYNTTLVRSERIQQIAQMERLINEEVGSIPHYFTVQPIAHTGNLKGPVPRMTPDTPNAIQHIWTWEWRW